jgi:hypothetical protein
MKTTTSESPRPEAVGATKPKTPTEASGAPSPATAMAGGGAAMGIGATPSAMQPAGARFRPPEAPSLASGGETGMARKPNKTTP